MPITRAVVDTSTSTVSILSEWSWDLSFDDVVGTRKCGNFSAIVLLEEDDSGFWFGVCEEPSGDIVYESPKIFNTRQTASNNATRALRRMAEREPSHYISPRR